MVKFLSFTALMGIVLTSCTHNFKPKAEKNDTVIVAYKDQQFGWRLNTAIRKQFMGRKFVADSGLDAKLEYISVYRLQLAPLKADSIIDSATHKLLRIIPKYQPQWLSDTLSHYITVLDSTNTIKP